MTQPKEFGAEKVRPEREPTPEVAAALVELEAARAGVRESLDAVTEATQSALDVPAKIRRHPVKTAALVGGAGFLIAGGPRRLMRATLGRVRPEKPDPYEGLLPPEIERVLTDAGLARDTEIRRALNKDFAENLNSKGRYGPPPSGATTFWRTFDRLAGPLGTAGARILVQRIMEAERDRAHVRNEIRKSTRKGNAGP